jgi:hypothetical protein
MISAEARARNKGARRTRERLTEGTDVSSFIDRHPGTSTEETGEMAENAFKRGERSASFFCLAFSVLPTCPRDDGGSRPGGKSRR